MTIAYGREDDENTVMHCAECLEPIQEDELYWDLPNGNICQLCGEELRAETVLKRYFGMQREAARRES